MEVNPSVPVKTVPEFITHAKANSGKINMATAGTQSASRYSALGSGWEARWRVSKGLPQPGRPADASWGFPAARLSRGSRFRYPAMCSRPVRDRMHFRQVKRREFITLLGGAAAAWPVGAGAQQPGQGDPPGGRCRGTRAPGGLFYGLRDLGYVEGQNLIIERRSSEGRPERWSELASELVGLRVDAIVVSTTPAALAAMKATGTIPIIFPTAFDLVGVGLAKSLPRPGGNITGVALHVPEVSAKGLTLLQEAVPGLRKVAVI